MALSTFYFNKTDNVYILSEQFLHTNWNSLYQWNGPPNPKLRNLFLIEILPPKP